MKQFVLNAYELIATLAPLLVAYYFILKRARRSESACIGFIPFLLFALYLAAVCFVTGTGTVFNLANAGGDPFLTHTNMIPYLGNGDPRGFILNVIMLVPLGFMLPLFWKHADQLLPVVVFGATFSLIIELSQLLNIRNTDIDDFIANTLGTLFGFLLFVVWRHVTKYIANKRSTNRGRHHAGDHSPHIEYRGHSSQSPHNAWIALREPAFFTALALISHFLLFNAQILSFM